MNCVSPTPKEATACPTYLFIIQQTFIERMLYTGHCVKCVRDTKTTKFCFQVTEFNISHTDIPTFDQVYSWYTEGQEETGP